jgi:hypothetical protein
MSGETRPKVDLTKARGDPFAMLGLARVALREAGYSRAQMAAFTDEAMKGGSEHLFATIREYCNVE